jgi:cytochrome c-type biogenesis protein CcmF
VAIAVSSGLADREAATLARGESVEFAGYSITFEKTEDHAESDRVITDAHLVFHQDGRVAHVATPRLTAFANQPQAVGAPSVWTRPGSDIYVAPSTLQPDTVSVNLYRFPLLSWLWVGGALMVAGGLWALGGRRRRLAPDSAAAPPVPAEVSSGA